MNKSERSDTKLMEMVVRGSEFKDDYEFELYGETVTAIIQPLVDDEFLPIAALLSAKLDLDEDIDEDKAVSEAIDKVEDADADEEEGAPVDVTEFDDEFVAIMQEAARYGLYGAYDDNGDAVEYDDDEVDYIVSEMMGGYSIELGSKVLEISGDVRDAEKFRGGRGSVKRSRDS